MAVPKIYYDGTKDEWVVVHNETDSGAICFGDCTGSSGNCTGSLPCGDTGVFGGGGLNGYSTIYNTIDYITISTPSNAQDFGDLTIARREFAATSNGTNDRGVFGGGSTNTSAWDGYDVNTIDYITISSPGNAQDFGDLTIARDGLTATSNGTNNRGVFGGGDKNLNSYVKTIDYITILTPSNAQNFGNLTVAKEHLAATSNGTNNRGVFGGGWDNNKIFSTIDYITISTPSNATNFGDLTVARHHLAATSNATKDRGVFGGGFNSGNNISTIDYITISTPGNAQNFGNLSVARDGLTATSNGINDRGVFGGGGGANGNIFSTIDYITISSLGNAQNFGNLTGSRGLLASTSNA